MLLAADTHDFNAVRENLGMAVMAVVVLVFWLLYRKMIELTRRLERQTGPWREKLQSAGVTVDFLDALSGLHRVPQEPPFTWLTFPLLGAGNDTFFRSELPEVRGALGASADLTPVFVEGTGEAVVLVREGERARFVRVKGTQVVAEFASFEALLEDLLKRVKASGVGEVQLRRLGEALGCKATEAVLLKLPLLQGGEGRGEE
ncbi:MAG: hypothetical protein U0228_08955 [Myxococcaceae bacterium]